MLNKQRWVVIVCKQIHPTHMNSFDQISEIQRLLRNLIRIATVSAVNLDGELCPVDTGKNTTNWLHWLSTLAGKSRS